MALLILSYSGARFLLPTSAGKMRLPSLYNCTILYCDNLFCSPVHVPSPGLIEDIVAKDVGDFPKLAGNHPPHLQLYIQYITGVQYSMYRTGYVSPELDYTVQ